MSSDLFQVFIFAGEPSGDLHGEQLILALRKTHPSLKICAVAGPRMRALGVHTLLPMEAFQVMGFIDVFLELPRLIRQFRSLKKQLLALQPKVALFIDYPGFNLRMEKALKKQGFRGKICHYICPSVWAWGKGRIKTLVNYCDLLLLILPFEKELFADTPLKVAYIGHPLITRLKEHPLTPSKNQAQKLLALFPGSRTKEIRRNLPLHLRVAKKLASLYPDLHIAISLSHPKFSSLMESYLKEMEIEAELVPPENTYELMRSTTLALAKSGTVTLELALHETPSVVTYGVSLLDLFIARDILRIRLPHYCLVNILAGKTVFPELIGPRFTEKALFDAACTLLTSSHAREEQKEGCRFVRGLLGEKNASEEAAIQIFQEIY